MQNDTVLTVNPAVLAGRNLGSVSASELIELSEPLLDVVSGAAGASIDPSGVARG